MNNFQLVIPNPPKELQSRDTCGSGDLVSVGLIDWLLTHYQGTRELVGRDLADGIVAGQRLLPQRTVPMRVREVSSRNTVRITCAAY